MCEYIIFDLDQGSVVVGGEGDDFHTVFDEEWIQLFHNMQYRFFKIQQSYKSK